eukprot:3544727-Rhodomonas_salina.1
MPVGHSNLDRGRGVSHGVESPATASSFLVQRHGLSVAARRTSTNAALSFSSLSFFENKIALAFACARHSNRVRFQRHFSQPRVELATPGKLKLGGWEWVSDLVLGSSLDVDDDVAAEQSTALGLGA